MKKLLITGFAIAISLSATYAQGFKIGIKAGADLNKIDGKSFKEQFSFGYQAGLFSQIGITKKIGIQPELILSQVNLDTTGSFKDVYQIKDIGKMQLQYLKIPLLLTYSPNPFVSFQAGPQFGTLLNKSSSLAQNGSAAFKQGDFSMVGGIQLNISKIRLYGRYGVGLNNINDLGSQEKWKNQNIQVGLGFAF